MKTKTVELFADLYPGWHLNNINTALCVTTTPILEPPFKGCKRVRIIVELPCIGGDAYVSETVTSKVLE